MAGQPLANLALAVDQGQEGCGRVMESMANSRNLISQHDIRPLLLYNTLTSTAHHEQQLSPLFSVSLERRLCRVFHCLYLELQRRATFATLGHCSSGR